MSQRIKVYTAVRMTGRYMDEMRLEAEMLSRALANYGFECVSPVLEENIPYLHEILANVPPERLEMYWKRDKQLIRECDVLLDYKTQNKSDGANKELGYARWCLWKPVVRVWEGQGALISRMEDDQVVGSLPEALDLIGALYGHYDKLRAWRQGMLDRCFGNWLAYQHGMNERYGVTTVPVSRREII